MSGSEAPSSNPGEHAFKFFCQKSNSDYLSAAREQFEQFLQSYNIKTYPFTAPPKRPDSFAEAFAHFPSKLLSTPTLSGRIAMPCCRRSTEVSLLHQIPPTSVMSTRS